MLKFLEGTDLCHSFYLPSRKITSSLPSINTYVFEISVGKAEHIITKLLMPDDLGLGSAINLPYDRMQVHKTNFLNSKSG